MLKQALVYLPSNNFVFNIPMNKIVHWTCKKVRTSFPRKAQNRGPVTLIQRADNSSFSNTVQNCTTRLGTKNHKGWAAAAPVRLPFLFWVRLDLKEKWYVVIHRNKIKWYSVDYIANQVNQAHKHWLNKILYCTKNK